MKKLIYITYQTFPANTANSLQSISNIKYLAKNGCDVDLYFPLREKDSTDNFELINKFYSSDVVFNIFGIKHNYPHGKINYFKSIFYHISHYLWSKKTVKKYFKNNQENMFITRSDWIAYFLGTQGSMVTFEIHQTSKLRTFIIKKISKLKNVKIIFLNENLKNRYSKLIANKNIVLHNGVDSSLFKNDIVKEKNKIVFLGKLTRFNQSRGIENLIKFFNNKFLKENYKLEIIGCSPEEKVEISRLVKKYKLEKQIAVFGWMNRKNSINKIQSAEYGLLLNTSNNKHSYLYTSPLKYFEYLYSDLKVLAVDFPSHRSLPLSQFISFFDIDNTQTFIKALKNARNLNHPKPEELSTITLDTRAKKIIKFIF